MKPLPIALAALFLIAAATNERHDLMPRVIELTEAQMQHRYCGAVEGCEAPVAMYASGVMYVRTGFYAHSPEDASVLLHEFVHHLQHMMGSDLCRGAKERQAYAVQEEWLAENGITPGEPWAYFPGPMLRMMIESCEGW